jgi:RES domain-containing protein
MIERSIGPDAVFHRYHTPKWASEPLSGAGAAIGGGRFNRIGIEALYLSAENQTAYEEYGQGASIAPPATCASYFVTLSRVVDLTGRPDLSGWAPFWSDWDCAWKAILRLQKRIPPSWLCGDEAIRAGCDGILFPSTRRAGGTNLVVFPANAEDGTVRVHDLQAALPRNRSSWDP